jgi:hypothetical protein
MILIHRNATNPTKIRGCDVDSIYLIDNQLLIPKQLIIIAVINLIF